MRLLPASRRVKRAGVRLGVHQGQYPGNFQVRRSVVQQRWLACGTLLTIIRLSPAWITPDGRLSMAYR